MTLSLALFAQLAAACGPWVHTDTLAAVARAESAFNPLAIADNTSGRAHAPATRRAAEALARDLLREGHSLDLGLMQLNSTTLARLGLGVAAAFEPCRNIAAGAQVLAAGFDPRNGEDAQQALVRALSRYNTGTPSHGVANGYVARVRAAATLVPAIRLEGTARPDPDPPAALPPAAGPPDPPAWDVYAQARRARARSHPLPASRPPDHPPARPAGP